MREGSSFGRIKGRGGCGHFHRGFPLEKVDQILNEARSLRGVRGPEVLKDSPETTITRHGFALDGKTWRLCVKRYYSRGWTDQLRALFHWSRAKRAWVTGWGLQIRDIPSPIPWVMLIEKSFGLPREGFVAMDEVQDAIPLSRYVGKRLIAPSGVNTANRRRFIETTAGYIARLHESEIYHRDLKATNLLVRETEDGWAISLVDHDHIRFDRALAYKERVMNLAQLNASVSEEVRPMDRWRFLLIYSDGASREEIRRMAADIAKISARR
jgi:tRNA A-37 threonylcarbamoyl transferase component Bud32